MSGATSSVYRHIIDDVIRCIRVEFLNEGLDDSIIMELQNMWETRLNQAEPQQAPPQPQDAISTTATTTSTSSTNHIQSAPEQVRQSLNSLRQINSSPQSFGKPQQFMPKNDIVATTLAGLSNNGNTSTTSTTSSTTTTTSASSSTGTTSPNQQQQQQLPSAHSLRSIMNIPQNDGSFESKEEMDQYIIDKLSKNQNQSCSFSITIPQLDGNGGDEVGEEDMEEHRPDASVDPQDSLNSDLDDDEEDDQGQEIEHFVLCQYEKVSRIKNKRKCVLKDGVMHLNGRDYLFNKANGELVWK
ncbi:transcription factor IIA [Cavenderia fasciculata]|uniref:Transcription factor IIA n=1 Tax=Cavenderia fasciculata TaxID=261658 RepID=F4PU78_CACFS|nr:transcription factor IIA [Cavenderia fasciculata]EGG21004.1 transcription factor IIA [Cavenderia fasciculata]|eukprot:XP_004358854.1 transcription factor IIA [Cavenderia fasciculata]